MARRRFTLEDKIKIVDELNNGLTHAQVCKKYELTSSTLSTFKHQLGVINSTQPKDYQSSIKEKALEDENRKLKELIGKKELELDILQDLFKKKELPKVEEKVALAKEYTQKGMNISRACKLLQISKSTFYPKKKSIKNEDEPRCKVGRPIPGFSNGINNCMVDDSVIETLLHEACERLPFYGYKKITKVLRKNHGLQINAKKVYRLAKKLGLLLPYVKHTKQGHLAVAREVTDINQLWQIDIKYIKALNGQFIMLTDIIDVCSRKLVGREITKTATTNDALKAIKRALIENDVTYNIVLRSDNGPQFTSVKFEQFCKINNIYHELIPTNSPNYNAHIESFHSLLSRECITWNEIKNFTDGYLIIDEYIKFYNEERIHGSLNYMSPNEFIRESMN